MRRDNLNYLLVGGVVLVAFALAMLILFRVTGEGRGGDEYYTFYEQVSGLRFGTPVYYEGYRIGQVSSVEPEHTRSQTRFRIELDVEKGWPIPVDSVAQVASAGLLADVFIYIREGKSEQILSPGSQLEPRQGFDLFTALNDLAGEFSNIADEEVRPLLSLVRKRFDTISESLSENTPPLVAEVREVVRKLNASAGGLETILSTENSGRITTILEHADAAALSISKLTRDLNQTRVDLDNAIAEYTALATENRPVLQQTLLTIQDTIDQLHARTRVIGFHLEEASRHFDEFSRGIRRNPNRLLFTPAADEAGTQE